MKETQDQLFCSFCGKPKELTKSLIAGPNGIYICDECVGLCNGIIRDEMVTDASLELPDTLPTPQEIKTFREMNKKVKGGRLLNRMPWVLLNSGEFLFQH